MLKANPTNKIGWLSAAIVKDYKTPEGDKTMSQKSRGFELLEKETIERFAREEIHLKIVNEQRKANLANGIRAKDIVRTLMKGEALKQGGA